MRGIQIENKIYGWAERIDAAAFVLKKSHAAAEKILTVLVIGVVFVLESIFILSSLVFVEVIEINTVEFWTTPNSTLVSFWLGIFLILFLVYRSMEAARLKVQIPRFEPETLETTEIKEFAKEEKVVNIADFFHKESMVAIEEAYKIATKFKHSEIAPIHLFVGTFSSSEVGIVFARLGLEFDQIKDAIARRLASIPSGNASANIGDKVQDVLLNAFLGTMKHRRQQVTTVELLMAAFHADEFIQELLYSKKIEEQDFENVVQWIRIRDQLRTRYSEYRKAAALKPKGAMNRAYTSLATPFLDSVSQDLTKSAVLGHLPMLVGREREMNSLLRAIEGGHQSIVLVGPPGVGKETIIAGLAERMVEERVPEILQDRRLVKISVPHIVSGAQGAEAQNRMLRAMQEIAVSGNIITVIEDIDQMVTGGLDLSAIVAQELEKGYTFVIATTSPEGYTSKIERSVLGQRLIKIEIDEPDTNTAIQILEAKIGGIEYKNKVLFTYEAISKLVELTGRYLHERYLPEKAIEMAQEVALSVHKDRGENARVNGEDVAIIVSERAKVPITEVAADEKETLLHMEERLHERVIGQDEAVKAVAAALRRARVNLRAEDRPIANFLFLGPTGVGKTELAKTVAEVYFGSEDIMLRFDMSEYQEKHSIERLIGATGKGGLITEAVRKNPFSLLLLDELEKAHPDILNLFLQVMDDGRLTDGAGRTIDFTNIILIATSNAGAEYLQDAVGAGKEMAEIKRHMMEVELKGIYRPEFLNRFDGVIIFKPLTQDEVTEIAYLMIGKVGERLKAKGINFRPTDEAVHELAVKGYDPKFGARPLRRVIQEDVDNAIANFLLKGEVSRRDTLVLEAGGVVKVEKAKEL